MLTAEWKRILASPTSRKCLLVTIVPNFQNASTTTDHPAKINGAIRLSTHRDVVVPLLRPIGNSITALPFWPLIGEWPKMAHLIEWLDRRAPRIQADLVILADALSRDTIEDFGGTSSFLFRIDIWSDGVALEQSIEWMAGSALRGDIKQNSTSIKVSLTDDIFNKDVPFGNGKITRSEFPDAPDETLDIRPRQIILGAFELDVIASQIDRFGKRFYLCDPPCSSAPIRYRLNGAEIPATKTPIAVTRHMAASGLEYTEIVFPDTLENLGLAQGTLTASNGVGVDPTSTPPLLFLLSTIGKYPITNQAEALAKMTSFQYSTILNARGNILTLLEDRLIPQTDLILFRRYGKIDLIPTSGSLPTHRMQVGTQIFQIGDPTETAEDAIFNDIEVFYGLDISQSLGLDFKFRRSVLLNEYTDGDLGRLLNESQKRHGRKSLSIKASDLLDQSAALKLAESIATSHALQHRIYNYQAQWLDGMMVDVGHRALITDPVAGWVDRPFRIVSKNPEPQGPVLIVISEDGLDF